MIKNVEKCAVNYSGPWEINTIAKRKTAFQKTQEHFPFTVSVGKSLVLPRT